MLYRQSGPQPTVGERPGVSRLIEGAISDGVLNQPADAGRSPASAQSVTAALGPARVP